MTDEPSILVPHTVAAARWTDLDEIEWEMERQFTEAEFTVARTPPESAARIKEAEILLTTFLPEDLFAAATNLQWIQALSAGVDFFDHALLQDQGIALTTAAGVQAEPVAEQVIAYILMFERGLLNGIRQQRRGVWKRYLGGEVRGKTLGIIGLGHIGSRVAQYGCALGMTVIGTKRDTSTKPDGVEEVHGPDCLFQVLERSDYLVISCPLTDDTRELIGADEIGVMKSDAVLVNVARGAVVDEDALTYALQQSVISGAALDVFVEEPLPAESPLWQLSNVVVTPHMAGSTGHKSRRLVEVFARNYEAFLAGGVDSLSNRVL